MRARKRATPDPETPPEDLLLPHGGGLWNEPQAHSSVDEYRGTTVHSETEEDRADSFPKAFCPPRPHGISLLLSRSDRPTMKRTRDDEMSRQLLLDAALAGDLALVEQALQNGADVNDNTLHANGMTPLHMACCRGHLDVVQELVARGANVEATDEFGRTPLHLACGNGHLDVVQELVARGANREATDYRWLDTSSLCLRQWSP